MKTVERALSWVAIVFLVSVATANAQADYPSRPVRVIVPFAPGGINTELIATSGLHKKFDADGFGMMKSERAAELAITAMVRRRSLEVPGWLNRLIAVVFKVLPHQALLPSVAAMYRPKTPANK